MNRKERPLFTIQTERYFPFNSNLLKLQHKKVSRRAFLIGSALFSTTYALPALVANAGSKEPGSSKSGSNKPSSNKFSQSHQQEPWLTINIVQQHLLPSEANSLGAKEINATEYLKRILQENFLSKEEKQFILNGPGWLNDLAKSKYKKNFPDLSNAEQNTLLRNIAQSSAGENWLATLLTYIFEALLAAPVYGGNPKGIGWNWLQHQPGFPMPDKQSLTWQALQKR